MIQVEATRGRSAALADRYIPIAPGTEAAFALGLAHVLLDEKLADAAFLDARTTGLADFAALAARFAPALVEQKTGAQAGVVTALARDLATNRPALVLGGDPAAAPLSGETEAAIAALNLLLGAPFGALPVRGEAPRETDGDAKLAAATSLDALPDGSVGLLLLDATVAEGLVPWARLERALASDALVVSLSPFRAGLGEKATLLIPGPAPLEESIELDGPVDAPFATLAFAPALLSSPKDLALPEEILREAAAAAGLSLPAPAPAHVPPRFSRPGAAVSSTRRRPRSSRRVTSRIRTLSASSSRAARAGSTTRPPSRRGASPSSGTARPRASSRPLSVPPRSCWRAPRPFPREALSAAPPSILLTKLTRETALFTPPAAATVTAARA